ncbi:hypothetical protein Z517_00704 [Fonsecaea pedrosoi CBS 271.37]|uniref:non-specific serine/threonine protein kinase n=1 Tax=Fonsecaea pedrosoi CBS 271.37 TaxID=1442368 RepID=A0A0D2HLF0_9EURO|nr:uncharacterized protein Z517_00704 [Fonsecaea pedrosoi CBS 271.37]KIW85314.1 hypothetical protein Z517_00704 [Fonsecaea pedrosoi CBS 271.37]
MLALRRTTLPYRYIYTFKSSPCPPLRCSPGLRNYSSTARGGRQDDNRTKKIEEETLPYYTPANFYPAYIGEILSKYEVVGKLGFGASSTVWLAQDLGQEKYVALKIFARDVSPNLAHEVKIYDYLSTIASEHPGRKHIRTCLDSFEVENPDGQHQCLVHQPLWESLRALQNQDSRRKLTEELLRPVLWCILQAIDYLHSECHLVHTDIKANNIVLGLGDESVLEAFVKEEAANPGPRNIYADRTIYQSRAITRPKTIGLPILSDFGLARFRGSDRDDMGPFLQRTSIRFLGPPPVSFLERSETSWKYFDHSGRLTTGVDLSDKQSLDTREERLDGENKRLFLEFVKSMLRWDPNERLTARELLDDPWLNNYNL